MQASKEREVLPSCRGLANLQNYGRTQFHNYPLSRPPFRMKKYERFGLFSWFARGNLKRIFWRIRPQILLPGSSPNATTDGAVKMVLLKSVDTQSGRCSLSGSSMAASSGNLGWSGYLSSLICLESIGRSIVNFEDSTESETRIWFHWAVKYKLSFHPLGYSQCAWQWIYYWPLYKL